MRKLFGTYGLIESFISIGMFIVFFKFNSLYFFGLASGEAVSDQTIFMVMFVDLILLVVIALPSIGKATSKISNEKIKSFLAFPQKGENLTFPVITEFLGNQALASFLGTVLVFTGRQAFSEFGGELIALYVFVLYVFAIIIAVLSLIRIVQYFTDIWWQYAIVSISSSAVMFAFFGIGIKMGT